MVRCSRPWTINSKRNLRYINKHSIKINRFSVIIQKVQSEKTCWRFSIFCWVGRCWSWKISSSPAAPPPGLQMPVQVGSVRPVEERYPQLQDGRGENTTTSSTWTWVQTAYFHLFSDTNTFLLNEFTEVSIDDLATQHPQTLSLPLPSAGLPVYSSIYVAFWLQTIGSSTQQLPAQEWLINVPILLVLAGTCALNRSTEEVARPLLVTMLGKHGCLAYFFLAGFWMKHGIKGYTRCLVLQVWEPFAIGTLTIQFMLRSKGFLFVWLKVALEESVCG